MEVQDGNRARPFEATAGTPYTILVGAFYGHGPGTRLKLNARMNP